MAVITGVLSLSDAELDSLLLIGIELTLGDPKSFACEECMLSSSLPCYMQSNRTRITLKQDKKRLRVIVVVPYKF